MTSRDTPADDRVLRDAGQEAPPPRHSEPSSTPDSELSALPRNGSDANAPSTPNAQAQKAWERGVEARLAELDDIVRAAALGDSVQALPGAGSDDQRGGSDESAGGGDAESSDEEFEPIFEHLGEWVEVYFAPTFIRRTTQTTRWCPSWWDHPEAYIRLEALWRSWEVCRLDAQRGMAVWFRDFLDGQLLTLFSPAGPFEECSGEDHRDRRPLPLRPAPDGWFITPE